MTFSLRSCVSSAVVATLVSTALVPSGSHASIGDLYASTGSGGGCEGNLATLYTLNPETAEATLVGPIMIGMTQARHVTGLAVHPSTGVLYGVMNGPVCEESTLLTINPDTAAATVVGSPNSLRGRIPDITFDPYGTLYGWSEGLDDELIIIDITNGTDTLVEDAPFGTSQTGIASDSGGRLFLKSGNWLTRVNQYNADNFGDGTNLDRGSHNLLAFDPNDILYSGERDSEGFTLFTIDPETGTTTVKGTNSVLNIAALAFDPGAVSPPDVSDLSLAKEVDIENILVGETVVFTLTVTNDGPDAANNVVVSDALPSNFAFDSATGDGSYDDVTGEWTVGSVADSATASIEITATAYSGGDYLNEAEVVASDSYDSDSVAGSGDEQGDMYASAAGSILLPTLFSIDRRDPYLWAVDPTFNTSDLAQEITIPGRTVCGGYGLTTQPGTTNLFGVVAIDDCGNAPRSLVTIDPVSAEATEIGPFGTTRIAAIAFGSDADTLYAVSGNSGDQQRKLFTVDTTDATLTQRCSLESSNWGRALTFVDGMLYDATYDCPMSGCQLVIRVINPGDFPVDPEDTCPGTTIETGLDREPTGMALDETGPGTVTLYVGSFYDLWSVTIPGQGQPADASYLGSMSHDTKGLATAAAAITKGNLQVTKSASKSRVKGDKFLDYLLYVSNSGPGTIENVELTDEIPFGTTFVSADFGCIEGGGVVTCTAPSLASGDSNFYSFRVQVTCKKCSEISNTAYVGTSGDAYEYPFDNSWGITTSVKGKF